MAEQVGKCNMPPQNALSVNAVKEEECQDDELVDDKVYISETAVVIDNVELLNPLICDEMKHELSTTLDNIKTEQSLSKMQYDLIHDNTKIEEGICPNDIKIEFDNGLLYCEDCHAYYQDYCTKCGMLMHILNRTILITPDDESRAVLPNNNILEIQDCSGESHIFASKVIPVGVKFGPFTGLIRTELPLKIKGGKFVVNKDKSKYLNWMQYINPARNAAERNLQVFQYEHNLYYESIRQIEVGDELLVHFGEEYEDSLNGNVEMDFIATAEHIIKDVFACTFCCLGFSSKSYLAKHKAICPSNLKGGFSVEELTQCPFCKLNLDQKEFIIHHMAYCCKINDRKCILPTTDDRMAQVNGRKTQFRQMYKCQRCKYRTKYKTELKKHTNLHNKVKTYKCEVCRRRFTTKKVLRLHLENTPICAGRKEDSELSAGLHTNVHVKTEYPCPQDEMKQSKCSLCEFRTKYKTSLERHMKIKHLKEFNYKCGTCDYRTNWKYHLRRHIETRHLNEFKYKCDRCDYKTNQKSHLDTHIKARHLKGFEYKCDTCDYKANHKSCLRSHIETRHLNEFKYKCDVCDYKSNVNCELKRHIKSRHLKEFRYKCDSCDYKTNQKSHLDTHVKARHLKQFEYKCNMCDYKTVWKFDLNIHIEARHLKSFKYKCDTCDYRTNWKYVLKSHIEVKHLKEFKYKCDGCDYKSNLKFMLKRHTEARHLKEYRYKCDGCDYKANLKSHLDVHVRARHLKGYEYKCDMCDYKTTRKSLLKPHMEARHLKAVKYKCDTCDYETNWKQALKRHTKTKHMK